MYRNLDANKIVETCRVSHEQIGARFPGSSLSKVAEEIHAVSSHAAELSGWLAKPHRPLRAIAGLGIVAVVIIVLEVILNVKFQLTFSSITDFLQGSEAAINEVVFLGIAVFFFFLLQNRLKRRRALQAIHLLCSMAHRIDMYQFTKDPERIVVPPPESETAAKRPQNPAELIRYLDYCCDQLALLSKIAALFVQNFDDPVTLSAVNEVENLTNGLSRKIWQKITIFDRILATGPAPAQAR